MKPRQEISITYLEGDATDPGVSGCKIIAHICNDIGAWGKGFVVSLSQRWPSAEKAYKKWFQMDSGMNVQELTPFRLGRMKLVRVSNEIFVANMIAQRGIKPDERGVPPIRYSALADCLAELRLHALDLKASIHMPRIGCGLAGGQWSKVEEIIKIELGDVPVFVYDFDPRNQNAVKWNP